MNPAVAVVFVFLGCCSNVVFLELIVKAHPGAGNIITFAQFLFIAVEGFIFAAHFGTKKPVIALHNYVLMVVLFFVVSVVNNWALKFNIPMPLHMIFRAGSLAANLILGMVLLGRRYTVLKYISVLMVTAGITVCTIASSSHMDSDSSATDGGWTGYITLLIGIGMLTFALFMSAAMGIYQEVLYKKFGKYPREALFYNHALPLPGFILLYSDISHHVIMFSSSPSLQVPALDVQVPIMWLFLLGNILTQYICIRSVFILTTECESLTVTLVVTLRKFASLIFSIFYFHNPFTTSHWLGTVLVFSGTLLFADVHLKLHRYVSTRRAKAGLDGKKED